MKRMIIKHECHYKCNKTNILVCSKLINAMFCIVSLLACLGIYVTAVAGVFRDISHSCSFVVWSENFSCEGLSDPMPPTRIESSHPYAFNVEINI